MISFRSDVLVCFGGRHDSLAELEKQHPKIQFKRIRQTHSDIVTEASDLLPEADAHYTARANEALLIATADCMPILIYCRQTKRVAAVHAGWRGIENRISEKTLKQLIATGSTKKEFQIWVGPHILQNSFEIDLATLKRLQTAQNDLNATDYVFQRGEKFYVALNKILESQIKNIVATPTQIHFLDIDTKTNSDYYSYRREQMTKERNLSFICLLS